jgi:hypothetical protein
VFFVFSVFFLSSPNKYQTPKPNCKQNKQKNTMQATTLASVTAVQGSKPSSQIQLAQKPSIITYFQSLSKEKLNQLYQDVFACLAVFRLLPSLAKQYILRLLLIEEAVPRSLLDSWIQSQAQQLHQQALDKLFELHIFEVKTDGKEADLASEIQRALDDSQAPAPVHIQMNTSFQKSLRRALSNQLSSLLAFAFILLYFLILNEFILCSGRTVFLQSH